MAKPVLGRGLGALLGGGVAGAQGNAPVQSPDSPMQSPPEKGGVRQMSVTQIRRCPFQPRKDFSEESIQELANSIQEQGIVQPLLVRSREDHFELIAGERRWRAAQLLGLGEVPVIVREADDRAVLELALIENLQRENLNPLEEALGYAQLVEQFQLKQEEVAVRVGKSRVVVANAMRLLKLAPEVQQYVRNGQLSVGHAKVLLGLNGLDEQVRATQRVLRDGLTVRQTEELVAKLQRLRSPGGSKSASGRGASGRGDVHVADLEQRLTERLGTKVSLRYRQGKGTIEVRFFNDQDLERVLEVIGVKLD